METLDSQAGDVVRSFWTKGEAALFIRTKADSVRVIAAGTSIAEQAQLLREAAALLESGE
jgi:hypothetical protein